jgi:tetratricopeptide (TPR) repeat protein
VERTSRRVAGGSLTNIFDVQPQNALGGAYTLERELGGGGMSRVFLAEETALKRKVVVKILPPDLFVGVNVERFNREILVAARLQHPHIVPVLAAGETNGIPYYTMPFVEGESLRVRLARGPLSVSETIGFLRDVAKALAYAHEHGVVHRDIKPDNVLVTGGSATVTDFGIAKAISASRTLDGQGRLTQVGTSIGTPAYMAPEQAAADPRTDQRADIYSFGCMAYELLSGRAPFAERSPQALLAAHMGEAPESIATLRPDAPRELSALISRCLEKEADRRPQSAAELVRTLETLATTGSLAMWLLGGPEAFWKALAIYAGAFVAVAILAKAAIVGIGLPDWVFPGSLIVMALGLPVVLWTGYVQRVTRRVMTTSPTITPGGTLFVTHGGIETIALKAAPHVNWYRAVRGGTYALGAFIAAIALFMALRALGVGPFGSLIAAGKLREREPLLLTDFRVINGDSTLGDLVGEAVRTSLEQSSVVDFVPRTTIRAELARMRRNGDAPLDERTARDLAQREGIKAILDGEIRGVGGKFFLTVHIISADSGLVLATAQAPANDVQELVFKAADKVAGQIRGRMGESLRQIQRAPPLEKFTTTSLEALRKATLAQRMILTGGDTAALPLAREAVALDSDFAGGYIRISLALNNLGIRRADAESAIAHAYRLRDRLPERERIGVVGEYYAYGPGRDRARGVADEQRMLDSGFFGGTNSLGIQLASRREFARAESLALIRIRVEPDAVITYYNLIAWRLAQGKVAAAESTLRQIQGRFPTSTARMPLSRARVAYAHDSIARSIAILDSAQRRQSRLDRVRDLTDLAELLFLQGRLREARQRQVERFAEDSARGADATPVADSLRDIRMDVWLFGPSPKAIDRMTRAVGSPEFTKAPVSARPYLAIASAYAFAGRADLARAMLARYEREVSDTTRKRWEKPDYDAAMGEIALAEHHPADAAVKFRAADLRPDGPATSCSACLYANLARVYDAASESTIPGASDSTIAVLERYFASTRSIQDDFFNRAVFSKRLAELYEAKGDNGRAAAYYTKFIALWKDADPTLQPKVAEAQRRLLTLEDQERVPKRVPN